MANPTKSDGVAANSASEAPAASTTSANATPTATTADPSAPQPYMTPMNGGATSGSGGGSSGSAGANGGAAPTGSAKSASTKGGKGGKGAAASGGGGGSEKATAAECKQAMDKAIDVMISGDSRFSGIPPEMLAQIKDQALSQAKGQQGDPCAKGDMTKAQYNCAMSASSSPAIQACLK